MAGEPDRPRTTERTPALRVRLRGRTGASGVSCGSRLPTGRLRERKTWGGPVRWEGEMEKCAWRADGRWLDGIYEGITAKGITYQEM